MYIYAVSSSLLQSRAGGDGHCWMQCNILRCNVSCCIVQQRNIFYCNILCCIVQQRNTFCCSTLFYSTQQRNAFCCNIFCYSTQQRNVACCNILCCIVQQRNVFCCIILRYITQQRNIFCCITFCCIILCCNIFCCNTFCCNIFCHIAQQRTLCCCNRSVATYYVTAIAFGVSSHLHLQSQSHWSLFDRRWHNVAQVEKRPMRWRLEIEMR